VLSRLPLTACVGTGEQQVPPLRTGRVPHVRHGSLGSTLATRLTLISNAATDAQRRATFPLDEALSEQEMARVAALGWRPPVAQRVLSGPERRVQQTAKALGLTAEVDLDLRDCDYGEWSGFDLTLIQSREPEGVAAWLTDPSAAPHGGEPILQLITRVGRWLEQHQDAGHTLAITHPAVIRSAIVFILQAPPHTFWRIDIVPLSLSDLRFNGQVWSVRSSGCALGI
jgi:broad specificity phosphatase PhoE